MTEQSLHLFTPSEVAEELALRDAEMLRRITPEEIRDGAWMHEDKASMHSWDTYLQCEMYRNDTIRTDYTISEQS